ncbi:MAG: cytochrome c biogenesis protein CcdA [Chloroflexi bacterium HGW-Chloroflexi-10]|nr:MAG: cytochrome c biogenesis protein CcdA [Chloroflexi bacterium HGW-Chloroflexi-10]
MSVNIGLAFLAGLASFLSPCVFSLVPAYISYLSGHSISVLKNSNDKKIQLNTLIHGFAFVLGFSLVFITLGLTASAIGFVFYNARIVLAKLGGIIVIIFGLHMTGIFRIPFLEVEFRAQSKAGSKRNLLTSLMMGVFFSAGWSPCIGPVLSFILTLAVNGGSLLEGVKLLAVYSSGLAIPFLIAAIGIGWVVTVIQKYGKFMHYVEVFMGIILIIVGILLFFGVLERLNQFGTFINLGL